MAKLKLGYHFFGPLCISSQVSEIMSTLVYVMITIRAGFLTTPIRITLNDLERPIHLKVRLGDGTLDVRMFNVVDFRPNNEGSNSAISGSIKSKMATGGHFEKFQMAIISATHCPLHFMYIHRPYTLPSDVVTRIYKLRRKLGPQNVKILAQFRTASRLDCEYPRNATRYRNSDNGAANCNHSRTCKFHLTNSCP